MGTTATLANAAWQNEFESESLFFENEVTQMAQKVHIVLVDDLDGSEASESVSFGLDGTSYEIDLNDANAAQLRDALAPYVGHARKVGAASRRNGRRSAPAA